MQRDKDYTSFYDSVKKDFGDKNIKDREVLSELMRQRRYHIKYDYDERATILLKPSQTQLDMAWDYLKTGVYRTEESYKTSYTSWVDQWGNIKIRDTRTGRFVKKEK